MGVFAVRVRFEGDPPSHEQVNQALRAQVGEDCVGYRREGRELVIHTSANAYTPEYVIKVLRDLGGVQVDLKTREPSDDQLSAFVEKPWLEHDEATRRAIVRAFEEATGQRE